MSELTRCNYCSYQALKARYAGEKLVTLGVDNWVNIYKLDSEPANGQGEPYEHNGKPIRFLAGYAALTNRCVC